MSVIVIELVNFSEQQFMTTICLYEFVIIKFIPFNILISATVALNAAIR